MRPGPSAERLSGGPGDVAGAARPARRGPSDGVVVSGLTLLALALRLVRLDAQSLWLDEVLSVIRAQVIPEVPEAYLFAGHGPLYFYVLAPFVALGDGEVLARLPSVLAGAALVPVGWRVGAELVGRREGLLAAAVVALSPFAVWYSQETRYVAVFMLFGGLSLLAAHRFVRLGTLRAGAAYLVATLLTIAAFVGGIFLVAGQTAWALLAGGWRRIAPWIAVQAVLGLLFLAWFLPAYGVDAGDLAQPEGVSRLRAGSQRPEEPVQMGYALYAFTAGLSWGPSVRELHDDVSLRTVRRRAPEVLVAVALGALVGIAGVARAFRRAPRGAWLLLAAIAFPVGAAYALAAVSGLPFNVRYTAGGFLPFAVLLGAGLASWVERPRAGVVVVVAFFLLLAASLARYWFEPRYAREDSRAAAAALARHRAANELLVVGTSTEPLDFYYDGDFVRFSRIELVPPGAPGAVTLPPRIWVAATRTWQSPAFARLVAAMEDCWPAERRFEFPGYEVVALRTAGAGRCGLRIEERQEVDRHRPPAPGE
jgi:4-amino-4-deoxy-L-arabinose transferase-like glycosyltransferase